MTDKRTMKKKKQWIWPRHRFVFDFFRVVGAPIVRWMYNIKTEPFKEQGGRSYLILMNHQTPFDQFFVVMSIKGPIYFIATEDIFSKGWISSVIRYLVNPIPIKKQTTDISAVMNCLRVAKEGGTIALAPEGNRTYSGELCNMNPAIASLAKRLKLPVVLYRIEGGYGVQPRWSDKRRKGPMRSCVSRVIEPEELAELSNEELMEVIREGLDSREYQIEERYRSNRRAEYMERAVYVCPYCGLSKFESHGNETECMTCHRKIHYGEDKTLSGVGFEFPFRNVGEWYEYQENFVNALDVTKLTEVPVFEDRSSLSEVIVNQRKQLLRKNAKLSLYGDRIVIDEGTAEEMVLDFERVTAAAVLGRNKANIYHDGHVYQLKSDAHFNALKYVNFYYRYKNSMTTGENNGKFLGL